MVGFPTVFIRLSGCPLRCGYCDTAYAFYGGEKITIPNIIQQVASYRVNNVLVTGGEPLAQPNVHLLLATLCNEGYKVALETSGALDVSQVDDRVMKVVDLKTPGSGESHRNLLSNFAHLNAGDQVKFVICDKSDYIWMKNMLTKHTVLQQTEILCSPSHGELPATQLAEWILNDRLPVRLQIQLHKYLWGNMPGK